MYQASTIIAIQLTRTMTSWVKRNGVARSTSVAAGVRFRKLKALGPDNAWPIAMVYHKQPVRAIALGLVLSSWWIGFRSQVQTMCFVGASRKNWYLSSAYTPNGWKYKRDLTKWYSMLRYFASLGALADYIQIYDSVMHGPYSSYTFRGRDTFHVSGARRPTQVRFRAITNR